MDTSSYTDEDARFDAEALGRCGACGREVSECGHCKECGRKGDNHAAYCSYRTIQYLVTDKETHRTFNLVLGGSESKELIALYELLRDGRNSHFAEVDTTSQEGAYWWGRYESQAEEGAYSPAGRPT